VIGQAAARPGTTAVRVSVYAVCGGTRRADPAVEVEVVPTRGTWMFANFIHAAPASDLLTQLGHLHA
jgi:hypothetical protein